MKKINKGIYLVLGTAIISGFSSFINKFGVSMVGKSAYQYTTLKNIVVALVLSLIVLTPFLLPKLKKLTKKQWGQLVLIGLVGGSFPFLLFFKGLTMTSAVSAAFLHKTLFIWVAILAWPILKEKLSEIQIWALVLLFVGNIVFLDPKSLSWGGAEVMILAATILWAIENVIAKITLRNVSAMVVAWGRMFFGAIVLVFYLLLTGQTVGMLALNGSQIGWLLLVAVFLLGYVTTWYSALKRLPITVVTSFLVLASPITTFLNAIFVTHTLQVEKIVGGLVILGAVLLFWRFKNKQVYEKAEKATAKI